MKFTLGWLKSYLETEAGLDDILKKLNEIGLEVEGVENPADKLGAFTIAEVIDAVPHPDADKLRVCTVNTGTETITVVCGAPNARKGMRAVLGRPGDYVPGLDVTLGLRKVRGVESNGMMCSIAELELGDDHDGIIDLPADAPVGEVYVKWAGLDDPVIEIAITPNRQDCLGVYGIARDLAAAGVGTLKHPSDAKIEGSFDSDIKVAVDLPADSADACSLFLGRRFKGVKNGPSPKWLQDRLKSIGLRPISALVDITNFISYDLARPLHVYDAAKVTGDLTARLAAAGESFLALDGKTYTAAGGETVIADNTAVLGFGGIMGGEASGCSEDTTDVILEVALFDPVRTAFTGRDQGINSDARYRFERGVDPLFAAQAVEIASKLILDLCGGTVSHVMQAGSTPVWNRTVPFRSERVRTLGGLDLPAASAVAILEKLGFKLEGNDPYTVHVPSWRVDVVGEADIVEEVLRIHGYDNIPSVQLPDLGHKAGATLSVRQKNARLVKRRLAAVGLNEAVTWSFMRRDQATFFGGGDNSLVVDNPISSELDCMRPSMLPNLMMAAQRNKDRGLQGVRLFEVGPVYKDDTEKGQLLVASGIRTLKMTERHWSAASAPVSVFDAKRDALAALEAAGAPIENLQVFAEAPDYYHPGRSGTLRLGPKNILASFGELHPGILKKMDIDGPVVGFEVFLDAIPQKKDKSAAKGAVSMTNLQSVERDFAFLVNRDKSAYDLIRAVKGADKAHISDVNVFDVYEGKGVPDGQKSLAVSVRLTPAIDTFSDKDIDMISDKVIAAATKAVGAVLRS
ncbi:phenylalanine--tRNA ligase subunit beta [Kordiimonas pumila]|uniref:Phenylalanine--tRNA ligase beta subunit n=1 Tax=Kordiimonas pumila TaxID=2161677 RepID=A0ABV7D5G1_9PROT|nr:phenylalanine--tRNA ligase subunit beta [Kordiimonas pumila]